MNLNYIKDYLKTRKETMSVTDIENLIKEIEAYQGTESAFSDITKIMKTVNEYNISFLTLVQEYEAFPKNDMRLLPQRSEKAREILCILSMLHTYLTLTLNTVKESTYNMQRIRSYMSDLADKKEHFKSEKFTWTAILKSLTQEMNFAVEMRRLDIEDTVGYLRCKDNK